MINMKIEKFKMQYYQEIMELWRKTGIGVGSSDAKEEIALILDRNPEFFLIGKEEEKIIAVVIGAFDGRRGYVHHLAVDPIYQKKKSRFGPHAQNNCFSWMIPRKFLRIEPLMCTIGKHRSHSTTIRTFRPYPTVMRLN